MTSSSRRSLARFVASSPVRSRTFRTTSPALVAVNDPVPDLDLVEDSPGNKVNLSKELAQGQGLIIGVPAAFSPSCSANHLPGYINHPKLKDAGRVFVVSVNDPFVMKAWSSTLDPAGQSGIRFLGDPSAAFNSALDLLFDSAAIFGNNRSKRYALLTQDGKITKLAIEPDNTGVDVSKADNLL
ncbi:MAG: hypothetical protein HETSPECPRED_003556 [Heterodermia speciosa]|uniref:Thioredoxin domain-containing protein n=1 Tax=Heterodermia speciosa TaxID=116794 RepID=A0A8H3IGD2_9LECA|nr:MAG: hypothetical protein HETSPECPRED_003556 [Heterodermia speciosa]